MLGWQYREDWSGTPQCASVLLLLRPSVRARVHMCVFISTAVEEICSSPSFCRVLIRTSLSKQNVISENKFYMHQWPAIKMCFLKNGAAQVGFVSAH